MTTLSDLQQLLSAQWLKKHNPGAEIQHLALDSRQHPAPAHALFFALPGQRHDGHRYLGEAWRAGIRHFVVSQYEGLPELPDSDILLVGNTLDALQQVAAAHRRRFRYPVIGITGSNGKTIVKEWLYQLLRADYNIVRSPKSYNSQVGVPLSVWPMNAGHELGIFEAGISRPGEMARLTEIIRPDIGIFTTLGPAHREGFQSDEEKVREKMRLFDHARVLIYCADHDKIAAAAQHWAGDGRKTFTWSKTGRPADLRITAQSPAPGGVTRLEALLGEQKTSIVIPFADAASIENAIHCWALLLHLGLPETRIRVRMRRLEPVEMRLELKAGINRCTLINDAYNADLASLQLALQFARQQVREGQTLTLVLSDILQSGERPASLYKKVAKLLHEHGVERLIGIGPAITAIQANLKDDLRSDFFPDSEVFLQKIAQLDFHDELILLKGARPFAFERIARRLEQKAHKTVLEVNLAALVHNLNVYTRLLRPGVKTLVMVKAAAYGSGGAEVAKLLEFHKVDYLGVAYADEGIELRQAGVQLPILVLNPEASGFDALYRYRLEPEVYSLAQLDDLLRYAGRDRPLTIHLKLDTGMRRLGFEEADLPALCARLQQHPHLRVQSVFSHLAASDAPAHDGFTRRQAELFLKNYAVIEAALGYAPLRHIVNTGGIARFPEYHFDMVRLGIGLYGIDSSGLQDQLRVVNTLKATISQVKSVSAGETVGYNRNGTVHRPSRIATISVGYADGFLRLAGGGRYAVGIHNQLAPTVGNVCMDMSMVDVTDIPEAREGDEVVVFGETPPVQDLAGALQTIPYEVFTNISERVKRVYWQE
ncbi:MAG: bifunctional UDP-N-acetylmuramoyl-tripeptide:D-alanyl-D-alanine ligase/alanine racemase [Saprospiraceae bacterium]|nr:bifunctional UDP-N-acetylmuramoyl-tripeptide:D-alanyl-D-alanine ligase/alanine racemase [Saprospiraceae bacterium]